MKHKSTPIFLVLLLVATLPLRAQNTTEVDDFAYAYAENYDSLLNSYYLKKYVHNNRHHRTTTVVEFSQVSDSLIAERLRSLHTVIPMNYNKEVRAYIRMYLNKMEDRLEAMLTLSEYYYPMFEEVLSRYGVPEELKYLTIVESAMNPMATSRMGAAGLWQFMYSTGKNYGMEVNSIVDDRRDPYKSTVAAARYLRDLYGVYNDWILAIAAYNCGPGNVNKAIARSGARDYWGIYNYLPRETRGYIPAFIAAVYVMKFYPEHGLHPQKLPVPIHSDTVLVHNDLLMCHISEMTHIPYEELRTLNPQYRVGLIPGSSGNYSLCLPIEKIPLFFELQDSIVRLTTDSLNAKPIVVESDRVESQSRRGSASANSKYHTVRKGETLSSISRKYNIPVRTLKKKNGLRSDKIRHGQRLRIK